MSRAYGYGALNNKYNTLLALGIGQGGGGGGNQNLQQVLDVSNTAIDQSIILNDTISTSTLSASRLQITEEFKEGEYTTTIGQGSNGTNPVINITNDLTAPTEYTAEMRPANMYLQTAKRGTGMFPAQKGLINMTAPNDSPPTITVQQEDQVSVSPQIYDTCLIKPNTIQMSSLINDATFDNATYAVNETVISTLTGTGDNNSAQVSTNGFSISLTNNDIPENPEPSNILDIGSLTIKTDQQDRDDSQTTILGQHSLNYQQILNQESKDLLQMNSNYLKMYDITTQTELVNLQNLNDLNGQLTLSSTENTHQMSLTNNSLVFSDGNSNNWSITQSTDTANNLTITQTGTAGYMDLNFNELLIRGGAGTAGQVLTSGGTNGNFTWETPGGSGGWVGVAESNLDMLSYDITSSDGTLNLNANDIEITGQANFTTPPHIPEPILGNDAASKGYVDSLVGQYAGGFNLFMNYTNIAPAPYGTYRELSAIIDINPVNILVTNPLVTGTQEIARFITEPLNLTEIPVGLWDAFIYGAVSGTAGDVHYFFELYKVNSVGTSTLLGTSGISPDVNSSPNNNPTSYSSTLTISTAISLDLTDRVSVVLYVNKSGVSVVSLSTYFEGNYYSFIQTSLNAGTTLLSSNNNWTGTNNFALNPTTPTKLSPADTDIINYGDIQRLSTPIVSTLEYYISTTSPYFQYPPAPPTTALIQLYQYYGWYFINSVIARNISWYFAPDYQMTVGDVRGLYMNYFNITTTSNDNLPFISIYTKPTGTNDAIPGFAHSVATYIANFTPLAASPYCSFMNISGTQPDPFPYGHILGGMILSPVAPNPRGEYLPTEEVLAVAVGSNSGSSVNQVNFIMSKVGICLEQGNQELILNPQNISEQPTLSTVLGFGSAAGNQSISGVNNLSATSITTPTLANGAATLTIGTAGQITNVLGTLQNNGTALPAYISAGGVASGSINMNTNNITSCPSLDSASALALGGTTATSVSVGRSAQTTNLLGNIQINSSSGTSGEVLTSTGSTTAPTFQALPTPYISASGVSSGIVNMGNFGITNSGGLDASGTPVAIGQASASLGVSIGRATQTTNLNGNVQINSSSGTSGQILTSTGASTAPTWQTLAVALSPSVQSNATASGISASVGIGKCRQLDITIVSGAKYLISGSFVVYSSGAAPQQNTSLVYMGIGQQAQTASPSAVSSIPITTNTGFMNSPVMNEDTCLSTVQFQNYPAEQYTLANSYVWTAPAAAAGSRTFALWYRVAGTITTSIIFVNFTFSVTRIV